MLPNISDLKPMSDEPRPSFKPRKKILVNKGFFPITILHVALIRLRLLDIDLIGLRLLGVVLIGSRLLDVVLIGLEL